jgi:hypothetical protein
MNKLRRLHTYLGVFFAPLLLFFICTGWYQTMNPDRRKSPEEAESVWDRARAVHADSVLPNPEAERYATKPFRYFVVATSVAFIVTTIAGLILAFRFTRNKWAIAICLVLGLAVPVALLILGQKTAPPPADEHSAIQPEGRHELSKAFLDSCKSVKRLS